MDYTDELPDPKEYAGARRKLEFLASGHGQGYTFHRGPYTTLTQDEDGPWGDNDIDMRAPDGEWAGSITHDQDGRVSHFYVEKDHRAAMPALMLEAVRQANALGMVLPHPQSGQSVSPRAHRMVSRLMPNMSRNVKSTGKDLDNYGD